MCADGELVGLAGVLGVLAHGGGQFLHRCGGFFQVGSLLLGAARQVAVAGGDLAGGRVDLLAGVLDPGDDAAELFGGGVGVVAHPGEHALEVAVHAHRQVALRERGEQVGDLFDTGRVGIQQTVELLGQLQEEAFLAVAVDAAGEVAGRCLGDHAGNFGFHQGFRGTVAPFDDVADGLALLVGDGGDHLGELGLAELHRAAADAMLLQLGQGLGIDFAAVLQRRGRLADQRSGGVEVRQVLADVGFVLVQRLLQGAVAVDDGVVGIGQVDAGGAVIQRGTDAQVLAGDGLVGFGALAQIALHALHGLQQIADFILAADVDMAVQLAAGDIVGDRDGAAHAAHQRTGKQIYQHQAQGGAAQQGDDGQRGRGGVGGFGFLAGGACETVVFSNQRFERRRGLAMLGAGFADEGVHGIVGQVQFEHFGNGVVGRQRIGPILGEGVKQLLLLGIVDQRGVFLDRGVDLGAKLRGTGLGFGLDVIAGADEALVGGVAVLADHATQLTGGADAVHPGAGQFGGDVVE